MREEIGVRETRTPHNVILSAAKNLSVVDRFFSFR